MFRKKFAKAGLVDKANNVKAGDDLGRGIAQRLKGKKIKYIASGMGDTPLTEYNTLKEAKDARKIFEKDYLERQLMRFKGNIAKTSSFVGMDRSALHRKLKELEINFKN